MRTETRWADFTAAAVERGCLSSISVPLPDHGALLGALNVYATSPRAFDETACEVGRSFAAFASVAIRNVVRYETAKREAEALQRAMESRAVIEQAKGLLMGRHRCTADEAFEMLVHLSQSRNVKLRDVAAALIAETVESRPDAD